MIKDFLELFNSSPISILLNKAEILKSLYHPEKLFGFTYHAHMIPPFKPDHTLILGYGEGTVAELMRKIWGQCKITGIDSQYYHPLYNEYMLETIDAYDFVKECADATIKTRFDYIILDLFDLDSNEPPDFIFDANFVMRLREICTKLLCTNIFVNDVKRMRAYYDYGFKYEQHREVYGNRVIYWSVEK